MVDLSDAITEFDGAHRFLSNFYPCKVMWMLTSDGSPMIYPSAEHAFQASKTWDQKWRERICCASTAAIAKSLGRKCPLRSDWERVKTTVMRDVVYAKFRQNPKLLKKLLATGDRFLVEGNTWNDTFWGVYNGYGLNWLGHILMQVREELR